MLQIEHVPLDSLVPADYNQRRMPDAQMAALMRSLSEFGWVDPVVVNSNTGRIVGGHQRVEAAKRLQAQAKRKADRDHWATVPVVWVDMTEGRERALNVALNKISGEFDLPKLADLLQGLDLDDFGFTGFTADELDALVASVVPDVSDGEPAEGLTDPDDVPEAPAEPITKPGDLWILGRHRLLCGDSTNVTDVERLMGVAKADMVWTDPPYNAAFAGRSGNFDVIKNDDLPEAEFSDFLRGFVATLAVVNAPEQYVCCRWEMLPELIPMLGGVRSCIVWAKNVFGMGRGYRRQHEMILYKGAFDSTTESDLWQHARDAGQNYVHPTQKPVDLVERAITNSSKAKDAVLDLFGGSGSTLIAAERTGRSAYLMELDPKYCDVIVRRWEAHTGQKARLEGSDAHGQA